MGARAGSPLIKSLFQVVRVKVDYTLLQGRDRLKANIAQKWVFISEQKYLVYIHLKRDK